MASHFVRWVVNPPLTPETMRVPQDVMTSAGHLPDKRRGRFLAARALLAQLMLRVYGIRDLPPLIASSSPVATMTRVAPSTITLIATRMTPCGIVRP